MLEKNKTLNFDDKVKNKNNNLNIISTDTKSPNSSLHISHSYIYKKSNFYNLEMNQTNNKRIIPRRKGTSSLDTKKRKTIYLIKLKLKN